MKVYDSKNFTEPADIKDDGHSYHKRTDFRNLDLDSLSPVLFIFIYIYIFRTWSQRSPTHAAETDILI